MGLDHGTVEGVENSDHAAMWWVGPKLDALAGVP